MMLVGTVNLLIMTAATPGVAPFPIYDLDAYCLQANPPGARASALEQQRCLGEEQGARDALQATWSILPVPTRQRCEGVARASGGGSYVVLRLCVEEARQSGHS